MVDGAMKAGRRAPETDEQIEARLRREAWLRRKDMATERRLSAAAAAEAKTEAIGALGRIYGLLGMPPDGFVQRVPRGARKDQPRHRWRGQPVQRGSLTADGPWEDAWLTRQSKGQLWEWEGAVEAMWDEELAAARRLGGPKPPIAVVKTARFFARLARAGRFIRPSHAGIVEALKSYGLTAVKEALRWLADRKFLEWQRRKRPALDEGSDVQVKQTSNLYRLSIVHERVLSALGVRRRTITPDDVASAERIKERARKWMEAAETGLVDKLDRLGVAMGSGGSVKSRKVVEP
jgi:hypothetical protein